MKARLTCNSNNLLGQQFKDFFNCDFFSRSSGFDVTNVLNREEFIKDTPNYQWTINITNGGDFSASCLLCELEKYCYAQSHDHKVFNIGSYICLGLINAPGTKYPSEKASLKFCHERIAYSFAYHQGHLDSYLLNLNFIQSMSAHIENYYTHLKTLSLKNINENIKFMLDNPNIKQLSVQSKQPGNHRINDGIGPIFPGMF